MDCMWSTTICKECELLCCKAILAKLHHHTWQVTAEAGYWQISEVLVLGAAFQPINLLVQNITNIPHPQQRRKNSIVKVQARMPWVCRPSF
jgi:hypothetical protein